MIEGSSGKLRMIKILKKGMVFDKAEYICRVELYDSQEEKMLITTDKHNLGKVSLDARYECEIDTEDQVLLCEGVIKERYEDQQGSMLEFHVQNGFYEKL